MATLEVDIFSFLGFDVHRIIDEARKNAIKNNIGKKHFFDDLTEIVCIGLTRGNVRLDHLIKTNPKGANKIRTLMQRYNIPARSNAKTKVLMLPHTLTFARSISCFPHIASFILLKKDYMVKTLSCNDFNVNSLPKAMRHSGFGGLIPHKINKDLIRIYYMAHVAYMISFSRTIAPHTSYTDKEMFETQSTFEDIAFNNSPYSEKQRNEVIIACDLDHAINFLLVIKVANNLLIELGEDTFNVKRIYEKFVKGDYLQLVDDLGKLVIVPEQKFKSIPAKLKLSNNMGETIKFSTVGSPSSMIKSKQVADDHSEAEEEFSDDESFETFVTDDDVLRKYVKDMPNLPGFDSLTDEQKTSLGTILKSAEKEQKKLKRKQMSDIEELISPQGKRSRMETRSIHQKKERAKDKKDKEKEDKRKEKDKDKDKEAELLK